MSIFDDPNMYFVFYFIKNVSKYYRLDVKNSSKGILIFHKAWYQPIKLWVEEGDNTKSEGFQGFVIITESGWWRLSDASTNWNVRYILVHFNLVLLTLTCLVTLFDRKLQVFQKLAKVDHFWPIYRTFVHSKCKCNVEWDFFCDFQTPWSYSFIKTNVMLVQNLFFYVVHTNFVN